MDSPFPHLELDDSCWQGEDAIPGWQGLAAVFVPPPGDEDEGKSPAPEQTAAYALLKAEGAASADVVREAVLVYARGLGEPYGILPDLSDVLLREKVSLTAVHIHAVAKDGLAYLGFEVECDWDGEHGCGVLTHAGRVVSVGQADESFEEWIAKKDGGVALE